MKKSCVVRMIVLFGLIGTTLLVRGQNGPNMQFGIIPTAAYEHYDIDTINMDNGNVVLRIPLISFPQLGKLHLSYSIVANIGPWEPTYSCSLDGTSCGYSYNRNRFVNTPVVVNDAAIGIYGYQDTTGECHPTAGGSGTTCEEFDHFKMGVVDSTGAFHAIYLNSNDQTELRATDGTGWVYRPGYAGADYRPIPAGAMPHAYDSDGVDYKFSELGSLLSISDRDGNNLNFSSNGISDSRGILIPTMSSSTAEGCPSIDAAFQPVSLAQTWVVPGPNGKSLTYKLCYANIYIRTNFFGGSSCSADGADNSTCFFETATSDIALQSVVLPDKTYWAFTYDSANYSDSTSTGYGNILSIHYPLGGTVSYTYWGTSACYGGGMDGQPQTLAVKTRTVSDINGHNYNWTYQFARPYDAQYQGNTVTDSNNNDTVYTYATSPFYQGSMNCADREISVKHYQGTGAGRTLLKTVSTEYEMAPEPTTAYGAPSAQYGNLFPSLVTTTLANGDVTLESNSYEAGSFSAISWSCKVTTGDPNCQNAQSYINGGAKTLKFGYPTYKEVYDANVSLLRATQTTYKWTGHPDYLQANLLNTPEAITVTDPNGQVAKTTNTYDDSDYIDNQTIGGRLTSVTRWNESGDSPASWTYWNSQGMVKKTKDAKGNIRVTYTYDPAYGGLFPTDVKNALNQSTTYTYDNITGSLASITTPNNKTTTYTYYDSGRLKEIQYPDSGDTQYSYSVEQTLPSAGNLATITSTVKQDDSISRSSVSTVDGIGRIIRAAMSAPEGSITVETNYDGQDQVTYKSNPYIGAVAGGSSFSYDALGRITSSCYLPSNDCRLTVYSGFSSLITDEMQHQTKLILDRLGRMTDVYEDVTGANLHTQYTYSGRDDLISVTQFGNGSEAHRVKSFAYDSLSRLKSSKTESGFICYGQGDGTEAGCQSDGYDKNGNLVYRTDARGTLTSFAYDTLDRLLGKTYTGGNAATTRSSCYEYDTATNGIGLLGSEWTQSGSCPGSSPSNPETRRLISKYDEVGRIKEEQQCHRGVCSAPTTSSMHYDLVGNLTYYKNDIDSIELNRTYDPAGRLHAIDSSLYGGQYPSFPSNLLTISGFTPAGSIQNMTLGPNLNITRSYDQRLRITGEVVTRP